MEIKLDKFFSIYKDLYKKNPSETAPFAYWKMIELFKDSKIEYLPRHDTYYVIRDNHLISYISNNSVCHLSKKELNGLDCITILKEIYESVEDELVGFKKAIIEPLYFDFSYKLEANLDSRYEVVNLDVENESHFIKACEIINEDLGEFFKKENIVKMTTFPSFDPKYWFFIRDKNKDELVAVSISTYCEEVKEVDIDWMYIRNNYQRQGIGRFMISETVRRAKDANIIRVSGKNEFYKKCGFVAKELWVWVAKPHFSFHAPAIQPNILD